MTMSSGQLARSRVASWFGPDDVLADCASPALALWYRRLAASSEAHGGVLAPLLLRLWLDNRDPRAKKVIAAHSNLTGSAVVRDAIAYHRSVYLTERKERVGGGVEKWAGVIPRLQGVGYPKWDGSGELALVYQSLAAFSDVDTASFAFNAMSLAEADVFTSLHNFQLRTEVVVVLQQGAAGKTTVIFKKFQARALDRYDWDPAKHLTMPNPDYRVQAPWAIRPDLQRIVVFHANAKRLERDGLAAPYDLETAPWDVTDRAVLAPAVVDPGRRL
jgi:hypothetical protein